MKVAILYDTASIYRAGWKKYGSHKVDISKLLDFIITFGCPATCLAYTLDTRKMKRFTEALNRYGFDVVTVPGEHLRVGCKEIILPTYYSSLYSSALKEEANGSRVIVISSSLEVEQILKDTAKAVVMGIDLPPTWRTSYGDRVFEVTKSFVGENK